MLVLPSSSRRSCFQLQATFHFVLSGVQSPQGLQFIGLPCLLFISTLPKLSSESCVEGSSYEQCQVNVVRKNCLSVMSAIPITLVFIFLDDCYSRGKTIPVC